MKKFLILTIALIFTTNLFSQIASQLIQTQTPLRDTTPPNFVWVDRSVGIPYRFYLADATKLRFSTNNIKGLSDSVVVMGGRNGLVKISQMNSMYDSLNTRQRKFIGSSSLFVKGDGVATALTMGNVIDALTFIPYNASNPSNFIGAASSDVLTNKSGNISMWTNNVGYLTSVPAQSFSSLTGKPTSLSGYGITDAYPLTGNPSNFVITEADPNVPAYSKGLTAFSVIKAATDPLYRSISYVPSFSDITSKPTTLSGYGITDAYPLSSNPSAFLTSINSSQVTTALGYTPYNGATNPNGYLTSVAAQSFASLTGKPTTLSGYGITDAQPLNSNLTSIGALTTTTFGRSLLTEASATSLKTTLSLNNLDNTSDANKPVSTAQAAADALKENTANKQNSLTVDGSGVKFPTVDAVNAGLATKGSGTVTSVALSSTDFNISSGSPVTTSGTIVANLNTSGVAAGTYGRVTVNNKGIVTSGKRQETYSGTTNASGVYTTTFGTAYSAAPNIQANIIGGTPNQFITMTVTTTGFTCTVYQRNTVNLLSTELLLGTTVLVNGANVDILISEK